jgi:hypothetical protein
MVLQLSGCNPHPQPTSYGGFMDITALIIQLVSGAIGGNVAGGALKKFSLGPLWNSILGIVGGGVGGQIVSAVLGGGGMPDVAAGAAAGGALNLESIIGSIAGGGVGGGILMLIVGAIRNAMTRSA